MKGHVLRHDEELHHTIIKLEDINHHKTKKIICISTEKDAEINNYFKIK